MFKRIAGTKDILPDEAPLWQEIEKISRRAFSLYNYKEIRLPLLEEESLFNRSLGETAEIVQKQMFIIRSKDDVYALRPEGTASIVRAYLENSLDKTSGFIKLYYLGPMFRFERPQKGRMRQFHHIGCEAIGATDPGLDVEVISLADTLLKKLSISGYTIKLNTLGCAKDKAALSTYLAGALKEKLPELCADCQVRMDKNPLRTLDCKNETCKKVVAGLKITGEHLCPECREHFTQVKNGLDALGVKYETAGLLVRGLDYYTGTVFEITHPELGAQDAIGAGGRYNNLVKELGGESKGAVGFAFGVERLVLATKLKADIQPEKLVYLIALGKEAQEARIKLLAQLRENGIAADTDYEDKSLKGALRKANDLGANFVLIIGEDEIKKGLFTLKDMATGEQKQLSTQQLIEELK